MSINKHFVVKKGLIVNATSANVIAEFKSNDAIFIPEGTTGERPASAANGYFRYNSTLAEFEGYQAGTWSPVGSGANVTAGTVTPVTDQKLGDMWFNTTEEILYLYVNNGVDDVWLDILTDPSRPTFTAAASAPGGAGHIDVWYDTGDEVLSMWVNDGTNDVWMDIVTSTAIANQYVDTQTSQTFTNTETATARSNMSVAHIMALADQNLIVNGGFEISQENGATVANTSNYYSADQWRFVLNGGQNCNTYQSTTGTDHFDYSGAIVVKVANASPNTASYIRYRQFIEGTFTKKLGWGTSSALPVTYGFWATSNQTMTFCSCLRNSLANRTYINEHTIDAADTWQYYTGVIPGDTGGTWYSNTSVGIDLNIAISCGTDDQNTASSWHTDSALATSGITNFGGFGAGNTFLLTGAFLLPGEHTISSEDAIYLQRPYDDELRKCQRYFEVFNEDEDLNTWFGTGYARTTTEGRFIWKYREIKRVPTTSHSMTASDYGIDQASGGNKAGSSVAFNSPAAESVDIRLTCAASLVAGEAVTMIGNTKITSDARL